MIPIRPRRPRTSATTLAGAVLLGLAACADQATAPTTQRSPAMDRATADPLRPAAAVGAPSASRAPTAAVGSVLSSAVVAGPRMYVADGGTLITSIDPASLTTDVTESFDAVPVPNGAGTGVVTGSGVAIAEHLAGQTVTARTYDGPFGLETFDALSGTPTTPLTLVGAPLGENIYWLNYSGFGYGRVAAGDRGGLIGEGAVSLLFDHDQSEVGFSVVGANGGRVVATFFRRDGSRIGTTSFGVNDNASFAFRKADGVADIAAISLENTDPAGIAYGLIRFRSAPANQAPIARAGGPYAGNEGSVISFSGATSTDPNGDALTYAWDLNADGTYGDAADAALDASGGNAAGASAARAFGDDGGYTVGLRVSDPTGLSSTATAGVTVANVAPTVTGFSAPGQVVLAGSSTTAAITGVTFTDPGAADGPFTTAIQCGNDTAADASGTCTYSAADVGTRTVRVTVTDKDGGTSAAFTRQVQVIYAWTGFFQPIVNPAVLNVVKAGSAIPVKFRLGADYGLAIIAAQYPISKPMSCSATSGTDPLTETVTAGGSSLSYDAAANQYVYVWKTEKSWAGSCRQLTVRLIDGTEHVANFQFSR
jgi:hypothetical protein